MKKIILISLVLFSCAKEKEEEIVVQQKSTKDFIGLYNPLKYCYNLQNSKQCLDQTGQTELEITDKHVIMATSNALRDSLEYDFDGIYYYLVKSGKTLEFRGDTLRILNPNSYHEFVKTL